VKTGKNADRSLDQVFISILIINHFDLGHIVNTIRNSIVNSPNTSALDASGRGASNETEGPTAPELKAAQAAVAALATASKSFTLYPAGHVMAKNQIDTLGQTLAAFFEHAAELNLEIGRDGLTYRENLLYQPLPADDPLLPPLLRDGVLWIAFKKGVDENQLAFFLEVVNRHRVLMDEPEGDLVTELWQADLKHIQYDAIEEFWDVKPHFDFSQFSVGPNELAKLEEEAGGPTADTGGDSGETKTSDEARDRQTRAAIQIEQPTTRRELMRLSKKENELLNAQVAALETQDNTATVRDILLFTLAQQKDDAEFSAFLRVLHDLLFDLLSNGQAGHFHDLLRGVRLLQKNTTTAWQRTALQAFVTQLSSKKAWEGHTQFFKELHDLSSAEQLRVQHMINLLDPSFVTVLLPELNHIRGSALHQNLIAAAAKLAGRNIQALEKCLSGSDEATLRQMVMVLGEMAGDRPEALLKRMGRHPTGAVRETAVRTLLAKSATPVDTIMNFLGDDHAGVRNTALDHISRAQDPKLETALRNYIKSDPSAEQDEDHLLRCYKALGKCGSQASVTFLGEILLSRSAGGLLRFGANAHRHGAALALKHAPGKHARQLLEKAGKSLFPAIRSAFRKAMTD
jgi:hypothetical protein